MTVHMHQLPLKKLAAIHRQYINTITMGYSVNSSTTELHMPHQEKYAIPITHSIIFTTTPMRLARYPALAYGVSPLTMGMVRIHS